MAEFHVRHDQMERFLRAESSLQENREIVRHLLAECPLCRERMRAAARRAGFKIPAEPPRGGAAPTLRLASAG
jgi:hypothetical protein